MKYKILIRKIIAVLISVTLVSGPASADNSDKQLMKFANKLYKEKKYDEALEVYKELLKKTPDSPIMNYNTGSIYYKQEEYDTAIKSFTRALSTEDSSLEKDALLGIANSYYRLSELKEDENIKTSIDLCKKSLVYYKRAIEVDERDKSLKYNHEIADKRVKALVKKSKYIKKSSSKAGKRKTGRQKQEDER
ncbi:MAG: tetratricopeptide repeat protein, partial [Candidatus Omnitrophota bacterium]